MWGFSRLAEFCNNWIQKFLCMFDRTMIQEVFKYSYPGRHAEHSAILLVSCPCEASRAIVCWPDEVLRPLESLGALVSLPVSAVCGRRNAMEWKCEHCEEKLK